MLQHLPFYIFYEFMNIDFAAADKSLLLFKSSSISPCFDNNFLRLWCS